ncbi:hypothetical protein [Clavibacter zhangzhiyongii]|uniref:hypothetical protein n=1 Tax=Clavibacter zhangzhiyongii TaxID=2768071 RepID=UPI0039E1909A
MDIRDRTPSLTHLRDFTRARSTSRQTHVARDYAQVAESAESQFFAFYYEKFITSAIEYIANGSMGGALDRCVEDAPVTKKASYAAAARGLTSILGTVPIMSAKRQQNTMTARDDNNQGLVSLRTHLILELEDGSRVAAHMHFSGSKLVPAEQAILETAVALAVSQNGQGLIPALMLVRPGLLQLIDTNEALTQDRLIFLEEESAAYRDEWLSM